MNFHAASGNASFCQSFANLVLQSTGGERGLRKSMQIELSSFVECSAFYDVQILKEPVQRLDSADALFSGNSLSLRKWRTSGESDAI